MGKRWDNGGDGRRNGYISLRAYQEKAREVKGKGKGKKTKLEFKGRAREGEEKGSRRGWGILGKKALFTRNSFPT